MVGKLYMIPVPLSMDGVETLSPKAIQKAITLKYYFVEKLRTARRFLKKMDSEVLIDEIQFSEVNRQHPADLNTLEDWLKAGHEVGLMSEAGCPGVADPGAAVVAKAHQLGAEVVPFPGPNSMLLALMGSGFNGQSYRFSGYLPIKPSARQKAIKELERLAVQRKETQIFMETPYRNNQLFQELLALCKEQTLIGVAVDLTTPQQLIKTKSVKAWKEQMPDLHKRLVVFTLFSA